MIDRHLLVGRPAPRVRLQARVRAQVPSSARSAGDRAGGGQTAAVGLEGTTEGRVSSKRPGTQPGSVPRIVGVLARPSVGRLSDRVHDAALLVLGLAGVVAYAAILTGAAVSIGGVS